MSDFTPLQQKILKQLADGERHKRDEIIENVDVTMTPKHLSVQLCHIRKSLYILNFDIICEFHERNIYYRWVRKLSADHVRDIIKQGKFTKTEVMLLELMQDGKRILKKDLMEHLNGSLPKSMTRHTTALRKKLQPFKSTVVCELYQRSFCHRWVMHLRSS